MKSGTDRSTGQPLGGIDYLRQRLADVINTPLGSLVGAREFGSRLYQMTDRNINRTYYMDCYTRLAEAINNPANGLDDFKLSEMIVTPLGDGKIEHTIIGDVLSNGEPITLSGIILNDSN